LWDLWEFATNSITRFKGALIVIFSINSLRQRGNAWGHWHYMWCLTFLLCANFCTNVIFFLYHIFLIFWKKKIQNLRKIWIFFNRFWFKFLFVNIYFIIYFLSKIKFMRWGFTKTRAFTVGTKGSPNFGNAPP